MKTVTQYIASLVEDAVATNTVGDGTGAVKLMAKPIGDIAKRKNPVDIEEADIAGIEIGSKGLLANVQAPNDTGVEIEKGATDKDADAHKKHMFHLKQNFSNDQVISA